MSLLAGCHHVALHTTDMDRFVRFYTEVFEGTVLGGEVDGDVHDVIIDLGNGFVLHPFKFGAGSPHAPGKPDMFDRGHIDHLALRVTDVETFEELRRRLVEAGACDGSVTDFGSVRSIWFEDPDGMGCEVCITTDQPARPYRDRITEPFQAVSA